MKSNRWTAAVAAFGVLVAVDAFAQLGGLRGKLVDEEGNPLEGITCKIELEKGGGRTSTVTTKKNGEFVKAGLQSGNYIVTCEKEGYRRAAIAAPIAAFQQSDLGSTVIYRLAPGELSESQAARAKELLEKFNLSSESDDHQGTLNSLFELSKMMPDNPEINFNIAGTYEKLGDAEKALEYYQKAAELKPDFYDAWLAVGDLQGKRKSWAEAAAAMKKAVDLKATDPIAFLNYAVYAQNSGDLAAAETAYRKTLELDPAKALAHYQLGLIEVNKGQNDAAIAHFEKFLELAPTDPQADAAKTVVEALKQKKTQ
jgi:tetratricopeptide (TPR) repeat protein